jgi:hypothetical protein
MRDHGGRAGPARPCSGGGCGNTNGVASLSGSKQPTATTTAKPWSKQDAMQAALAFARCMRQHGIDMPDPKFNGDNITQRLPTRAEQNSPKFKAAQQACRQYQPDGGQPTPPTAQERQQALAFAQCMRQHGINMPDPQITAEGIDQQLPARMRPDDARLRAAEQACHQYGSLGPAKPGGPQRGGGGR